MFVEDQGGGYFAQSDLAARGTHILDTGSTKVYVWFGCGEVTKDECELAIRVAVRYMRKVPEMSEYQVG